MTSNIGLERGSKGKIYCEADNFFFYDVQQVKLLRRTDRQTDRPTGKTRAGRWRQPPVAACRPTNRRLPTEKPREKPTGAVRCLGETPGEAKYPNEALKCREIAEGA